MTFCPPCRISAQRRPAPGEACRKGLEVRGPRAGVLPVRQERRPRELPGRPIADGIQDRREDVDVPGERRVAALSGKGPRPEEKRHVERRLVCKEPVGLLAVLAPRLAVVGRHDEERWRRVDGANGVEQRGEGRVRERDVAQIEVVREALAELGGRVVGSVRVVDVDPQEARPARLPAVPVERRRHDRRPGALLDPELRGVLCLPVEHVVHVEPTGKAVTRVQREGRHEGAGRESRFAKDRRGRRETILEAEARVVPDAVLEGIEPRQDVDVRRERQDVLSVRERRRRARRPRRRRGAESCLACFRRTRRRPRGRCRSSRGRRRGCGQPPPRRRPAGTPPKELRSQGRRGRGRVSSRRRVGQTKARAEIPARAS
jgi:hypothetical protein